MNPLLPRRELLIAYIALYLAFAAAAARAFFQLDLVTNLPWMIILLVLFLLLLLVEPFLIARSLIFLHFVNLLQTISALVLLVWVTDLDYFALLFIIPCTQSILHFTRRTALAWIGFICLWMIIGLLTSFPLDESVGYVIIYPTAIFLFTSLSFLAKEAYQARNRSEALLEDLRKSNLKLQAYAAQVQELAAAGERNRLARELHDSVTQIIFGLTLSAQAARILLDRDPSRVAQQLDHMQALAQNALAEMRALIQQLHPSSAEEGLVAGLRRLAAERQASDGLAVELRVTGERRLPVQVEDGLLRVAGEALQNVIKHARAGQAAITLDLAVENRVVLCVEDNGAGFDPAKVVSMPGHLGLTSMIERVEALGGSLVIDSKPGKGTRLVVELAPVQEVEHA